MKEALRLNASEIVYEMQKVSGQLEHPGPGLPRSNFDFSSNCTT